MALTRFGFIVTGAQLNPAEHRIEMASPAFRMTAIGVSNPEQGVSVAMALVDEGVQLIELCGGFGPAWVARVLEAIGHRIPVGSVSYGPEAIDQMHALFQP